MQTLQIVRDEMPSINEDSEDSVRRRLADVERELMTMRQAQLAPVKNGGAWLSSLLDPKTLIIILGLFVSLILQWASQSNSIGRVADRIDTLSGRVGLIELHLNADYIPRAEHLVRDAALDERLSRIEINERNIEEKIDSMGATTRR